MINSALAIFVLLCVPLPILIPLYALDNALVNILKVVLLLALVASIMYLRRGPSPMRYVLAAYYFVFCALMFVKDARRLIV